MRSWWKALLWGILSVVLSPCHLSSIPLIVGFIDQQGRMSTRRAFFISAPFWSNECAASWSSSEDST